MTKKIWFVLFLWANNNLNAQLNPIAYDDEFFNARNEDVYDVKNNGNKDSDPNLENIYISAFETDKTSKKGANISVNSEDKIVFKPNPTYAGWDTFKYVIRNTSGLKATANVYIFIISKATSDFFTLDSNNTCLIKVLDNDIHSSNFSITLSTTNTPKFGTATLLNNDVCYTTTEDFEGKDTFGYEICDVYKDLSAPYCKEGLVIVERSPAKYNIPLGFSPNGDGINDIFEISNMKYFPYSVFTVYDRKGDKVWDSGMGYKNNWNGNNWNNESLPNGTYYYIFQPNRKDYPKKSGSITIMR